MKTNTSMSWSDWARRVILDCDDPTAAAVEWSHRTGVEVDPSGNVWLVTQWASGQELREFAEWLLYNRRGEKKMKTNTSTRGMDWARRVILDCDDPTASAAEWFGKIWAEVDHEGDVWFVDGNCWASDNDLRGFAEWLRREKKMKKKNASTRGSEWARRVILDCDDPTASAVEWSNNMGAEVDREGGVWIGNCWASDDELRSFAEWLLLPR